MRHPAFHIAVCNAYLYLVVLVLAPDGVSVAAEPDNPASVLVRKIYVPASKPAEWPTEGRAYLPIETERLDQLLSAAESSPGKMQAAVTSTELRAQLRDDGSISGIGALEVASPAAQTTAWLRFAPGRLRLNAVHWRNADHEALFGYWGNESELGLPVKADGLLDFGWRLSPSDGLARNSPLYELALPASLVTKLLLDLPVGKTPVPASGFGTLIMPAGEAPQGKSRQLLPAQDEQAPGTTRWSITCGPGDRLAWRVVEAESIAEPNQRLPAVREELWYDINLSGVELTQRFLLDELPNRRRPISVTVPEEMVLTSATGNGEPLSWSRVAGDDRYQLVLSPDVQPNASQSHEIELKAWSPLQLNSEWTLPQLKLLDTFWSSGRMHVGLSDSLRTDDITLSQVWQLPAPPTETELASHFQKLQPGGNVKLVLAREHPQAKVRVGRLVELSGAGSKATVVTSVAGAAPRIAAKGQGASHVYVLRGRLIGDWQIQAVESLLADQVADWYVTQAEGGERQLTVRFALDANLPRTMELTIDAFRSASARDAWLTLRDNVVVEWLEADVLVNLLAFSSDDSYEIEFSPLPPVMQEEDLMPSLGTILPADFGGQVFNLDTINNVASVHLSPESAAYHAEAIVDVVDQQDEWQWNYRLECTPRRGLVDRLQVVLPGGDREELRWKLVGDDAWREAELVPGREGSTTPIPAAGTSWQILLPQPQSTRFTVMVEGGDASLSEIVIRPPQVVSAEEQTSGVWVRSPAPGRLSVAAEGMELVSPATKPPLEGPPLHSTWQARTGDSREAASAAQLTLRRLPLRRVPPRAHIDRAVLESVYTPMSQSRHRYRLTIENSAETQLKCELPPAATEIRWQEVSDAASLPTSETAPRFDMPLPQARANTTFLIEFHLPGEQLSGSGRRTAPWPVLNVPVAVGVWDVQAPTAYRVLAAQIPVRAANWRERLFGPLAGPAGQQTSVDGQPDEHVLQSVRLLSAHAAPLSVRLVYLPRLWAARAVALMLALALGYWLWRWPRQFLLLLGASAIGALLLPAGGYEWARAVWAGLLLIAGIRGLQAAVAAVSALAVESTPATVAGRVVAIGGIVGLGLLANAAGAAPPASAARMENILIPVDAEGRVASKERFATPQLLQELLAREQQLQASGDWLISAATYQAALQADAGDTQFTLGSFQLIYELQTMHSNVEVRLPLDAREAKWEDTVSLDGVRVRLDWDDDGAGCRFRVRQSGRYQLRLSCQPKVESSETHQQVRLHIPPVPQATLQLDAPESATDVEVMGRPLVRDSMLTERRTIALDIERELTLRWPRRDSSQRTAGWQVEQWDWLHLSLTGAYVDGCYRIRGTTDELPKLELTSSEPARWVPLPDTAESAPASPDERRHSWTLTAEPDPTSGEERVSIVRFRLALDRLQPFGRVRFPQLRIRDLPAESRRIAVSYSDKLVVAIDSASPPTTDIRGESFAEHWPDEPTPDFALTLPLTGPPVVFAVRPTRTNTTPEESLQVGCFERQLRLRYQGDYPTPNERRLHHTLRISPELEVSAVEVNQSGQQVPARFSRPQQDRLVLFFDESMTEPFRLTLDATQPLDSNAATIPQVTSWSGSPATQRLTLFCAPRIAAQWRTVDAPPRLSESLLLPPEEWDAYGVGAFQIATRQASPLELALQSNDPQFDASTVTTIIREQGKWIAEVGLVVDVRQDTLSQIVLALPEMLVGEPEMDPPAYLSIDPSTEPRGRQLRVRFLQPVRAGEQYRATFRVAMRPTDPLEMEYPLIGVPGAQQIERYFGVVATFEGNWSWQGVEQTAAPAQVEAFLVAWPNAQLLRATGDEPPLVRWVAQSKDVELRELPLVEVDAQLTPGGAATLRTAFALPALDRNECQLHLPEHQQFLAARVDGDSAVVQRTEGDDYRIRLPGRQLPHVVELVTAHLPSLPYQGAAELQIPQLRMEETPLAPKHVIWRVSDLGATTQVTSSHAQPLSEVEQAALRLNQLLQTVGGSAEQEDASAEVHSAWAASWAATLGAAEKELRLVVADSTQRESLLVSPQSTLTEFDDLAARAQSQIAAFRRLAGEPTAAASTDDGQQAPPEIAPAARAYVLASDDPLRISIDSRSSGRGDATLRWALAAGMLLATVVLLTAADRISWRPSAAALVFPLSMVIGLIWWLWLWPHWLGLLVGSVAVVCWIRAAQNGGGWNAYRKSAPRA